MDCCSETACRACVTTKMIKNPQNAARGLAKKGEFECTECHSKCYCSFDTDQAVPLKVNLLAKGMLEQTQQQFQIFCKNHNQTYAERYCSNHRALLCKECTYETHTDHLNVCRPLNQLGITAFFKQNLVNASKLNQRIVALTEAVNELMDK